jgi:hypothetical protein
MRLAAKVTIRGEAAKYGGPHSDLLYSSVLTRFRFSLGMFKFLDRHQTSREKGFAVGSCCFWNRASWTDILVTRSERVNETFLTI